ncbi:MAG: cytochrome c biogenesis protein [Chloroflexi bacterium]|nr:cytochrome c biogenesis protein [Chloroflexota bacterium]
MKPKSSRRMDLLGLATLVTIVAGLYMAFVYAPTEVQMGLVYRIFYFHLGSVAAGFMGIVLVLIAGIAYLRTGSRAWDRLAEASAELGVVFCTIVLITGSIWARPIWGVWWTWDPRLTSFLILWLIYIAYLMLRASAPDDPRVARFSAVFGIVGAVDVPIVIMSARLWRSISPVLFQETAQGFTFGLTPEMLQTLVVCITAVMLLFVYLLIQRVRLEELRDELVSLRQNVSSREERPVARTAYAMTQSSDSP